MMRTVVWLPLAFGLVALPAWGSPDQQHDAPALPAEAAAAPELSPEDVRAELLDNLASMGLSEEEASAVAAELLTTVEPVEDGDAMLAEAPALSPDERALIER